MTNPDFDFYEASEKTLKYSDYNKVVTALGYDSIYEVIECNEDVAKRFREIYGEIWEDRVRDEPKCFLGGYITYCKNLEDGLFYIEKSLDPDIINTDICSSIGFYIDHVALKNKKFEKTVCYVPPKNSREEALVNLRYELQNLFAKEGVGITLLDEKEKVKIFDSKLGGMPYLPKGEPYPKDRYGKDMPLLVQINLKDLKDLNTNFSDFPTDGILEIFFIKNEDEEPEYMVKYFDDINDDYQIDFPKINTDDCIIKKERKIKLCGDYEDCSKSYYVTAPWYYNPNWKGDYPGVKGKALEYIKSMKYDEMYNVNESDVDEILFDIGINENEIFVGGHIECENECKNGLFYIEDLFKIGQTSKYYRIGFLINKEDLKNKRFENAICKIF